MVYEFQALEKHGMSSAWHGGQELDFPCCAVVYIFPCIVPQSRHLNLASFSFQPWEFIKQRAVGCPLAVGVSAQRESLLASFEGFSRTGDMKNLGLGASFHLFCASIVCSWVISAVGYKQWELTKVMREIIRGLGKLFLAKYLYWHYCTSTPATI